MAQSFGEYARPTDTIAAILGTYPFSIGLFRELIQNSDDAKASKQVFVLDLRKHSTDTLFDDKLAGTQGPSLLAYNDALFTQEDWEALQSIHRSSKKTDNTKIGKYGIGFRSCYHITDYPQILSGTSLAILDPHHHFSESGGTKLNFAELGDSCADHLSCFDFFLPLSNSRTPFSGSIIRLPLRTPESQSSISNKVVTPGEIRTLFRDFIEEELDISLLFLKHVSKIEIHEIDEQGVQTFLAGVSISKGSPSQWVNDGSHSTLIETISITSPSRNDAITWRILQSSFDQAESASLISYRLGRDAHPLLSKHKLVPSISLAVPMSIVTAEQTSGRLFTYLPLPIRTGFPCHVHGLFALTQSRQNLSNKTEIGIVRGSDDSVLVEWNQLLFEKYLPKAWATLLPILIEQDGLKQIYRAWPAAQPIVETGDSTYWQDLPRHLLTAVVSSGFMVWPLVPRSPKNRARNTPVAAFQNLRSVIVASSAIDVKALQALVDAGLNIIQPPEYIMRADINHTALTPDIAHAGLLHHVFELEQLGASDASASLAILEYLLSTKNLTLILGLPIIPLVSGKFATLQHDTPNVHVLLEKAEFATFQEFDGSAVPLDKLSNPTGELLLTQGTDGYNLKHLRPEHVVDYLRMSPFGIDFSTAEKFSETAVLWLSKFWEWLKEWKEKEALLPVISQFRLLPSRNGSLEFVGDGLFSGEALEASVQSALQLLQIKFLHPKFSVAARNALKDVPGTLRMPDADIHSLLDRIRFPIGSNLDKQTATVILDFLIPSILDFCRTERLSDSQRYKLRSLPIFPMLVPSKSPVKPEKTSRFLGIPLKAPKTNTTKAVGSIPDGATVYGVMTSTSFLLPLARDVVYLDGSNIDLAILSHIESENSVPLSEIDVVALTLEHFGEQSKFLQHAFLEYMVQQRDSLPPRLLKILQTTKFIPVIDGSLQSAEHVIDPTMPVMTLYTNSGDRVPRSMDDDAGFVLKQLRLLGVLRGILTAEILLERIQHISSIRDSHPKNAREISIRLVDLLSTSGFDCTHLEIPVDARWLPTNQGLLNHEECLDRGLHRPELFDEVYPLVEETISVSHSLRLALGWDKPLSFATLSQQFSLVISARGTNSAYKKLRVIIKEFSQRALSEEDLATLKDITDSRAWIPINSRYIATTSHAVFFLPLPLAGFHEIPPALADRPEIREFLFKMGCTERPSIDILVSELNNLHKYPASPDKTQMALLILKALPLSMTEEERSKILVPDVSGQLRPSSEVYFNDLGDRAFIEAGDLTLAHPQLNEQIAKRLHMSRLGLKFLHLKKPAVDMGEKLTTTIRNVLKQYTEQQTLTEFFANASDAGATEFKILVDDRHAPCERLLSPIMAPFQRCSSLIVYNNSTFTQTDFEGICKTGVGGKEGETSTIGQFGLGALSMFHFTELAMIVSGDKVLFLDPSKTHLPFDDWASLLLPLQQMQRMYSDHLAALNGLFGFKLSSTTSYDGTLFRLPLRNASHLNDCSILRSGQTADYVRDYIVWPYWKQAQQSLLFTRMRSVSTYYRHKSGRISGGWKVEVKADDSTTSDGDFSIRNRYIIGYASPKVEPVQERWTVVTTSLPVTSLPSEFNSLKEPHRLRSPIIVGLAARTTARSPSSHNLFSTLPLPMTSTLPCHLTASFILTPDRRHIRFDDYDNLESQYNRWILSTVAPPLYLTLLENLLVVVGRNDIWWPGNTTQQDSVTRLLVDRFYTDALPSCQRLICPSHFNPSIRIRPSDAVILGNQPASVTHVLELLRLPRYVAFPPIICERCSGHIKTFNQEVLRDEIALRGFSLIAGFETGKLTTNDIQSLLDYLLEDPSISLMDLPLLPLANGSLVPLHPADYKKKYYIWKLSSRKQTLFNSGDLVHLDFDANRLTQNGYNVSELQASDVANLMRPFITEADIFNAKSAKDEAWIKKYWKEFPSLNMDPDIHAQDFPVIPTIRPGHYVSMKACKNLPDVVTVGITEPDWLPDCLDKLGISAVRRNDERLPTSVRTVILAQPVVNIDQIIKLFEHKTSSFKALDDETLAKFTAWCRDKIGQCSSENISAARSLPIWPSPSQDGKQYLAAKEKRIAMVPYQFPHDVISPFMSSSCVEFSQGLRHLGVSPVGLDTLWKKLKLPKELGPDNTSAYKRLVTALISDQSFTIREIPLPNGTRRLVPSNTLYARDPLFTAAFGSSEAHFMLEEFIDLEARLGPFGLKSTNNLDTDTFLICATSINDDVSGRDRDGRARLVFMAYCEDLPLRIAVNENQSWRQLDNLRFIPRLPLRQKSMGIAELSPYVKQLPEVISPNEMILPEYEPIAWSQRAICTVRPAERVLLANPGLGKPANSDVIQHLRVLALEVARDHTFDRHVLSDLKATYKWLDEHQDEVGEEMIKLHQERLFLNVDDPKSDVWMWNSADEMFFNITETEEFKTVHKFLEPYKDLLYVSGVESISDPPRPEPVLSSVEAQFSKLREGFNVMRLEEKLTDVVFVTEDDQHFAAHRSFLSPMSEYLRDLFCGEFTEAGPASADEPIEVSVEYPGKCLKTVLDFIYTGTTPDFDDIGLSVLLDILDLSQYWGFTELNEITQARIIGGSFINPVTFDDILHRATVLDAKFLLDACEYYERKNKDAIHRLRGEGRVRRENPRYIPVKAKSTPIIPLDDNSPISNKLRPRKVRRFMHRISMSFSRRSRVVPQS
ncbi:uncharacterized protein EV420DRAFT_1713851 [Desarmillaria tabescens]|uniref:BTB domain-containing protein n=1 Tax=Armillaria tabescens TaxID=1929756 RepID=A0AA39JT72_ARMTA|nr:uncharacterized protein EV420DRAFT_1713851 [Desarmillaria tabescens]KAK0447435.1 hypothetical protein EV420DRAFT_1713851 [Desarmillaria tabescens]